MDLLSPLTYAAAYLAAGAGYLVSRLVAAYQARHTLFRGAAEAFPAVFAVVAAVVLLFISLFWPMHVVSAVTVRLQRRRRRGARE